MNNYFVIEGPDGSGKTTHLELLTKSLNGLNGYIVEHSREPGGPIISEEIRVILKNPEYKDSMLPLTRLLMFNAARAQTFAEHIIPVLQDPKRIIVADRCFLSTISYQGFAEGVSPDLVKQICDIAMMGVKPKQIFLLNVSFKEARRRMKLAQGERVNDVYDGRKASFHHKIRKGYAWGAHQYSDIVTIIDGEREKEAVAEEIFQKTLKYLD